MDNMAIRAKATTCVGEIARAFEDGDKETAKKASVELYDIIYELTKENKAE